MACLVLVHVGVGIREAQPPAQEVDGVGASRQKRPAGPDSMLAGVGAERPRRVVLRIERD